MSQAFNICNRRFFAAKLAVVLASLGMLLPATRLAAQVPVVTNAHQIHQMQEERLAILRTIVELIDQKRQQGGASMAELVLAKRNVAEAELELCSNPAERVKVLEQIVEDARILDGQAARLAQDHVASREVALTMKADLLRWQIRLEQARAELSGELNGSAQTPAHVSWAAPSAR